MKSHSIHLAKYTLYIKNTYLELQYLLNYTLYILQFKQRKSRLIVEFLSHSVRIYSNAVVYSHAIVLWYYCQFVL